MGPSPGSDSMGSWLKDSVVSVERTVANRIRMRAEGALGSQTTNVGSDAKEGLGGPLKYLGGTGFFEAMSYLNSCFGYVEVASMVTCGIYLLTYRILIKMRPNSRAEFLLGTKMSIGWVSGTIFLRACHAQSAVTILGSVVVSLLAGGPDIVPILLAWLWLWSTVLAGFVCRFSGDTMWTDIGVGISGLFLAMASMAVKQIFEHWELIILPALGSTATLINLGLPLGVLVDPVGMDVTPAFPKLATQRTLLTVWVGLTMIGAVLQITSYKKKTKVDLNRPDGAQNNIMQRLLNDEDISRNDMFEAKFPVLSTMAAPEQATSSAQAVTDFLQGQGGDPFRQVYSEAPTRSRTGGMLERAKEAGLTENQIKILEICETDEHERNRVLFGGGLW